MLTEPAYFHETSQPIKQVIIYIIRNYKIRTEFVHELVYEHINFGHLTETASPTQFRVGMLSQCDTHPILFCHFNLDVAGKGKMVTENLQKLLSLLRTYHTYLVHLEKTEGFFQ